MRCNLCGCLLEHKAKWKTTTCPDNPQRWDPQEPMEQSNDTHDPKFPPIPQLPADKKKVFTTNLDNLDDEITEEELKEKIREGKEWNKEHGKG